MTFACFIYINEIYISKTQSKKGKFDNAKEIFNRIGNRLDGVVFL